MGCMLAATSCGKTTTVEKEQGPNLKEENWKDYFPLAVGQEWHYRDDVRSAASREQKRTRKVTGTTTVKNVPCFIVETTTDGELTTQECLALTETGLVAYRQELKGPPFDFEPPQHRLTFPLADGAAWKWEGELPGIGKATVKYRAEGQEDVEVPAGKFTAIKVKVTDFQTSQLEVAESMQFGTSNVEVEPVCVHTLWLASNIGIVKETFKIKNVLITSELASCSLGDK